MEQVTKAQRDVGTLKALALSSVIQPLLHGHPSYIQSAALADLVSLWLAGHIVPGNPEGTQRTREGLFDDWCETVWKLVPASEKEIKEARRG